MSILYDERVDGALPTVDKAALLAELRQCLPDLDILHTQEDLKPYECDGLSAYRTTPMLVVLPERIEQVQQLLKLCHARGVPVVARGAGTGLSGGALPLEKGILLVMARFNQILEINREGRFARYSPAYATWRSPRPRHPSTCITPLIRPRRSPAPSVATSPKMPVACTA